MDQIKTIKAFETWPLRHQVMWPKMPFDFVKLDADTKGHHFGLFVKEELVSVISLFIADDLSAQFRKLATLKKHQNLGYGSKLLAHVIRYAQKQQVKELWCNARVDKIAFYEKFEMLKTDQTFIKETITFVILKKLL